MTLHNLFQSKMADGADFLNGDILEADKEMEEEFINEDENVSTRNTIFFFFFFFFSDKLTFYFFADDFFFFFNYFFLTILILIYLQHFTDPTSYINHLGTEN